jgi:hypothetical protein
MSYSERDKIQRKLKQAIGNLDTALTYVGQVREAYESAIKERGQNEEYQSIRDGCDHLGEAIATVMNGIETLQSYI